MEQLQLPLHRVLITTISKILSVVIIGAALIAVFFYYFFLYSKDQFVELFPSNTLAYVSLTLDPQADNSAILERYFADLGLREAAADALKNMAGNSHHRNLAIAVVPANGQNETVIVLEQPKGISPLVISQANKLNWRLYSAKKNDDSSRIIIASSDSVFPILQSVTERLTSSLGDSLTLQLALKSSVKSLGTVFLSSDFIKSLPFNENARKVLNTQPALIGALESIEPNIVIKSDDYSSDQELEIPQNLAFSLNAHKPRQQIGEEASNQMIAALLNNSGLRSDQEAVKFLQKLAPAQTGYKLDDKGNWQISLDLSDNGQTIETVKKITSNLINHKYLGVKDVQLPDSSVIKLNTINQAKLTQTGEAIEFSLPDEKQKFYLMVSDGKYIFSNSSLVADLETNRLEGCKTEISDDILITKSNFVLENTDSLKLGKYIVYAHNPQSYTQFILCLGY